MTGKGGDLAGRRVFVIEDESLVRMFIEDMLSDIGCEIVGTASRFDEAVSKANGLSFDVAILDVNLNGQPAFPIAKALSERGVPFVWATGYGSGGLPPTHQKAPILHKPFQQSDLERALRAALML